MKFTATYLFNKSAALIFLLIGGLVLVNALAQSFNATSITTTRLFPTYSSNTVSFNDSIIANPLLYISGDKPIIVVPNSNDKITALDGDTGALAWEISMPTPVGQTAEIMATPARVGDKLIVLYQCLENSLRVSHRLAVVDLIQRSIDSSFSNLELSAEKPTADGKSTVKFNPPYASSRAALKYVSKPGSSLGTIYASFGNAGDTQPFHGWLFEIEIETWQSQGQRKAVRNVLLTTPESDCPVSVEYGTQEMICGGGIWTPSGPQIYPTDNSYELFVPVGNGQIDLARQDYANTLMRVKPGLQFDSGCNEQLCKNFNPSEPEEACMASCKNLFIPRLTRQDKPLKPSKGECDDKSFWECLAWMDYDLGANAPVKAKLKNGQSVLVQPGKEGAVYLIDAHHLGTQYDRIQIVDVCGTITDPCKAGWMGMIVTQPALTYQGDTPIVIIPSFVPDKSHPAGLTALKIVLENGRPKFKQFWKFPNKLSQKAIDKFRSHPSLPVITRLKNSGEDVVWSVDIGNPGTLYGIRVNDGKVLVEQPLSGTGRQLSAPVLYKDKLYLVSTSANTGKSFIEAYRIQAKTND